MRTRTADGRLSVNVLTAVDEFIALEHEWNDLFAVAANPLTYLSHAWLRLSWRRSRYKKNSVRVIVVRDEGALVMSGAFVLTTRKDEPIVQFLGSGTPQIEDVLWRKTARTAEHADLLLETLRAEKGEHRRLRTRRVPEDSVFRDAVARAGLRVRQLKKDEYFFISLKEYRDFDAYFSALSPGLRSDHRRQMRRLDERGGVVFTIETGQRAREVLAWLFEHKRAWLTARSLPLASFANGRIDRFVTRFIESVGPSKYLVATLRVKGEIVAAGLHYLERDAVNLRILTHDPAFSAASPGRCLAMSVIAEAFSRGASTVTVGTTGHEWKSRLLTKHMYVLSERIRL